MKRLLLLVGLLVLIYSCASLPEPKVAEDSLVIGSLVLDFPDGFFNLPARKIEGTVFVNVHNVTKDSNFSVMTVSPGMFSFLSNGSDEYVIESYEYKEQSGAGGYTLGIQPFGSKFVASPGRVLYIGHITKTFAKPEIYRATGSGGSTWNFKESWAMNWDKNAVLAFLTIKNPKSAWLSREVLEVKLQATK
jgi:hypothetical protein